MATEEFVFTAQVTCGACPLQIEGKFKGKPYYFRLRHGQWRLHWDGPEGEVIATGFLANNQGEADTIDATNLIASVLGFTIRNDWDLKHD